MTLAPSLVLPSSAKLDLERLLRDLPKFKPWISAQSWESWEAFTAQTEKLDSITSIPWELPKLAANALTAEEARHRQPITSPPDKEDGSEFEKDEGPSMSRGRCVNRGHGRGRRMGRSRGRGGGRGTRSPTPTTPEPDVQAGGDPSGGAGRPRGRCREKGEAQGVVGVGEVVLHPLPLSRPDLMVRVVGMVKVVGWSRWWAWSGWAKRAWQRKRAWS